VILADFSPSQSSARAGDKKVSDKSPTAAAMGLFCMFHFSLLRWCVLRAARCVICSPRGLTTLSTTIFFD
jgi:hypothetical protein